MYLDKVFFNENNQPSEILVICNKCGKTINITDITKFETIKSEYCITKEYVTINCECGNKFSGIIQYKSNPKLKDILVIKHSTSLNKPKCPICQSTNLSKITMTKKVAKIAAFGIFGMGDNGKTWKCNNCGSKF